MTRWSEEEILQMRESLDRLASCQDEVLALFYARFFEAAPAARYLFQEDLRDHGRKLVRVLVNVVRNMDRWESLEPRLANLGARHEAYGVHPSHHDAFWIALSEALEKRGGAGAGEMQVWRRLIGEVLKSMMRGYASRV